jgi:DnaJ like chaperone protein
VSWRGKIIGAILGIIFIGPFGALVGLWLGHIVDQSQGYFFRSPREQINTRSKHIQQLFFRATFMVMGFMAKADGHISSREIAATEQVIRQFQLSKAQRKKAIAWFEEGKSPDFDWRDIVDQLREACRRNMPLIQLFMDIQRQVSSVDGMSHQKQAILQSIALQLGCQPSAQDFFSQFFEQMQQQQYSQQSYQYQQQGQGGRQYYRPPTTSQPHIDPYAVLGISRGATSAEIKKAYRRLMSQNHPDKLVAQGLPPEMIKAATEKTQLIQRAYQMLSD